MVSQQDSQPSLGSLWPGVLASGIATPTRYQELITVNLRLTQIQMGVWQ